MNGEYQLINDYDISVLIAMNKIQNNKEINTKDMTSWIAMKGLTKKGKEREDRKVTRSLEKMHKLELVIKSIKEYPKVIRIVWRINMKNVCLSKKDISCIIRNRKFIRGF